MNKILKVSSGLRLATERDRDVRSSMALTEWHLKREVPQAQATTSGTSGVGALTEAPSSGASSRGLGRTRKSAERNPRLEAGA